MQRKEEIKNLGKFIKIHQQIMFSFPYILFKKGKATIAMTRASG
jgi:hypothetical protein